MPPRYDPLTQEDDSQLDGDQILHNDLARATFFPRPAIYYGDGLFDVPSSDDDEDVITEKDRTTLLNRAEHGDLGSIDDGLYVGSHKVCRQEHQLI